jgi:L-malate glycosyltransferase
MKILHLSTALTWRGGEQQIAYLVDELDKNGQEQVVLCAAGSAMHQYCRNNNIPFKTCRKRSSFDLGFAFAIKKLCREKKFDLIHIHDSHAHTFAILSAVFFANKTKMVLSRRVDFEVSSNLFSKYKYNHPSIKKIICVSDKIRNVLHPVIQQKQKLITIHSGTDVSKFVGKIPKGILRKQFLVGPESLLIGNISAIAAHKDYFTFVDTAEILIYKNKLDARFFIIGDGEQKKQIEDYVREKKLEQYIYFTGFRNDVPDILCELNFFLITSKTEGLGTTILDAFASRVAVVATAAGGVPEIVVKGETGMLSPVADAPDLASNILKLVGNDALKKQLTDRAFEKAKTFDKSETALRTLKVYKEI